MGRHFNPLLTNYFCVLLVFTLTNPSGVNFNELSNLNFNLLRRKLQTDYPPLLNGNCVDDLTGNLEGIDFGPDLTVSCSDLVFWITEIGRLSGYDKFDCSISLSEINVQGTPLDMFGDISLQFLCPESCNHCEDPLSISDLPSNSTTPFYAELLFTSETCEYDSLSPGVHINPTFETSACMKHTFGDNAIASCGPGAEFDPLGPGRCSLGDGTPAPLMHMGGDIQTPEGWIPMDDIREDGTSNTCESLCLGYQPVCRAYMTKEQTHCAITDGLPTKTDGDNSYFCFRKGGFSRVLVQTFEEETCETETAISTYDSPLSCAPLEDGVYAQAIFDWETCAVETFAPSAIPTRFPTKEPSLVPSLVPTDEPTTLEPTNAPSKEPSVNPTRNPTVEPTAAPSLAPSLAPTTDGWCINDVASDSPRRFPGGAEDCFSGGDGLSSGSVNWLIDGVSLRMTNRGLLPDTHELCIIQHGDDFEWAVVSDDGYIYPTCVQSGDSNRETTTLVPNSDGGIIPTNLGRQANQLQNQRVFSRNNYMAIECPPVQSYCSTSVINDWWGDSVEEQVTAQTGSLDALADNWRDNICLGDDLAVRYITDEGIINTCTGYDYTDTASVKSTTCAGRNTWECGFKTFNSLELPVNLSPAYPINTFRAIARALTSEDYTYPECSFNNRKYCASESNEQRVQPRYTDTSNCVTDTNHPHYDNSINSVLASIRNKHAGTNYDLCYMEDSDGYLYYTIFVEGVGYPTCVQGPATEENCQADKYYCVEEERRNWPNTVANRLLAGQVFGSLTRNNHMHNACPTLQSICQASGLTAFEQESLQPAGLEGQFDNNICLGQDGGIRIVTEEGVKPTCVGYSWDTDLMGEGSEQLKPCPAERNFMCGSLQLASGEKTYGWLTAQRGLVHTALLQEDFLHPECPYVECREC